MIGKMQLFSILEASQWATDYIGKNVTTSNSRLLQFDRLRTNTFQLCLTGDSRNIDIFEQVKNKFVA